MRKLLNRYVHCPDGGDGLTDIYIRQHLHLCRQRFNEAILQKLKRNWASPKEIKLKASTRHKIYIFNVYLIEI